MHFQTSRRTIVLSVLGFLLLLTLPADAGKRRASSAPPAGTAIHADVTGVVRDAVTGAPVVGARVQIGSRKDDTDGQGQFELRGADGFDEFILYVERTGYADITLKVAPAGAGNVSITLQPAPTTIMRRTGGAVSQLDTDSISFGYNVPFSGFRDASYDEFCKPDGTEVTIDRDQMKRIVGPAVRVMYAPCCTEREVLRVRLELRDGTSGDYYFMDPCDGYQHIDIKGRNHVTGVYEAVHLTEVDEVIFP